MGVVNQAILYEVGGTHMLDNRGMYLKGGRVCLLLRRVKVKRQSVVISGS